MNIPGVSQLSQVHIMKQSYLSRSEEHTSELQSRQYLVCRLLLEKKIRRTAEAAVATGLFLGVEQVVGKQFCLPGQCLSAFQVAGCDSRFRLINELSDL